MSSTTDPAAVTGDRAEDAPGDDITPIVHNSASVDLADVRPIGGRPKGYVSYRPASKTKLGDGGVV